VGLDELTDQRVEYGDRQSVDVGVAVLVGQVVGERLIKVKPRAISRKIDRGRYEHL
jgi:hypothetical protein